MTISDATESRLTGQFGGNDLSPLSPRAYFDQLFPMLARVYVEVSDIHKEFGIILQDKRVWNAVARLLGFDPALDRYTYAAELHVQSWVLGRGREAETALYVADEIKQYDGLVALDYAAGWVRAMDQLDAALMPQRQDISAPSLEYIGREAQRETSIYKPIHDKEFREGYSDCILSKTDPNNSLLDSVNKG